MSEKPSPRSKFPFRFSLALSAVFLLFYAVGAFSGLDNGWVDTLFRWHRTSLPTGDPRIVIAAMDDDTVHEYGFPPPRSLHAQTLDKLKTLGVKSVVFDVMFLEKREHDEELIAATRRFGSVVHLFEGNIGADGKPRYQKTAPGLAEASRYVAYPDIDRVIDGDGHVRRAMLFHAQLDDPKTGRAPALSLDAAAYAVYTGEKPDGLVQKFGEKTGSGWDAKTLYLNFRQPKDWPLPPGRKANETGVGTYTPYRTLSIADVLHDRLTPEERKVLRGSLVLIGSTAIGYFDHYPTPFVSAGPGVEYHCNIIDNALHGDWLRPVSPWLIALILLAFVWLPLGFGALPPAAAAGAFAVLLAGWAFGSSAAFMRGVRVEFVAPALALVVSFLGQTVHRVLKEGADKRAIQQTFGRFVSPEVVKDLAENPDKAKIGAQERDMTVFFLDIAHFTTISEKVGNNIFEFLNVYLSALTEVVEAEMKGTVDKYIGDCVMAFWNAPLDQQDHRVRACLAALRCQEVMDRVNKTHKFPFELPELPAARIGVNSGLMKVGFTGSAQKLQYTVIGDEVNLGSRLEGANKFFGSRIMISESTYEGAKDHVEARELGRVRVVGKETPIRVYEPIGLKGKISPEWTKGIPIFNKGVRLWQDKKWAEAHAAFKEFRAIFPDDKAGEFYANEAEGYAAIGAPENYDGTINLTAK